MITRGGGGEPRRPLIGARALLAAAGALVLVAGLGACSSTGPRELGEVDASSTTEPATADPTSPGDAEPTDEPSEEPTDGSSSEQPSEEESSAEPIDPDDPPPAESESETLCNLTSDYVQTLYDNGSADNWAYMDVAALSLSDSLRVWRGLVTDFPESEEDIERAQSIFELWQEGSGAMTEGDVSRGEQLLTDSLDEIAELPDAADTDQVGCDQA